ncbi:semaphorin-5A-like [Salvelinus alpinus]
MAQPSAGRSSLTQHVVLLLQCILVLQAGGVVCRKGPVLLPESPCHRAEHPLISHTDMEPWIHRFRAEGTVDYSQLTFDPSQNELIHITFNSAQRFSEVVSDQLRLGLDELSKPNFVSSYDIGNFTYFFFRENALEHDCGRTVFSRAARVCKNDIGGRFLLEDTWTTFMKARLNCSRPGEIPFNYNELQGTFYLPELDLLYGIFTTNVNSIAASAVCAFNLSAITRVFGGPFKYQENSRSAWLPYPNPNPDFQCGTIDYGSYLNLTERNLQDAQKFLLMNEVIQPVQPVPYFMEDNVRFSHVAVDVVQGKDMLFHIIYLATDYGTIRKVLSPLNQSMGSCLLDEIELFPPRRRQPIRSLLILHSSSDLYVGVRDQVIKIPLMRCDFHKTREGCVGARDPYCGWDLVLRKCTTLEESVSMSQWEQSITKCPGTLQINGYCNEHLPCPPHVYWSAWSAWERCTVPCGGGIQSRRRTCENGNECPGCAQEYQSCNTQPCPDLKKTTPWTPWAPVNISDNGGHYEQRFRYTCKARVPEPALLEVGRQRIEMRYCSRDGSTGCSTDRDLLRSGKISGHTVNRDWTSWSSWSQCSRDCSRGIRSRKRFCDSPEPPHGGQTCLGPAQEYQECNITPCPVDGSWSCWSGWSMCSVTCGGGHYTRTRTCNNPPPAHGGDICLGLHTEEALCNIQSCPESWSNWSLWCQCDSSGSQLRVRHCNVLFPTGNQCSGNHTETRACPPDSNFIPEVSIARSSQEERRCGDFNVFHMIAVGLSSSILGCLVTLLVYTYCQRYQQQSHDATVIHPISASPLNTSITNHINKLDKYDSVDAIKAFNKNNLILEERNKYFNPQLAGKTYTNSYFTDLNTYDDY